MDISIPELLSDERSIGVFLLVSVLMGGGAAWLAGVGSRDYRRDLSATPITEASILEPHRMGLRLARWNLGR